MKSNETQSPGSLERRVIRRRWIVTFETGFVTFTSVIANEAFARKWASNLPDTPKGEKITNVRWEAA
jgi:hypothetical protein